MKLLSEIAADPKALSGYMIALAKATSSVVPMDCDFILVLVNETIGIPPQYVSNIPRESVDVSIRVLRQLADRLEAKANAGA